MNTICVIQLCSSPLHLVTWHGNKCVKSSLLGNGFKIIRCFGVSFKTFDQQWKFKFASNAPKGDITELVKLWNVRRNWKQLLQKGNFRLEERRVCSKHTTSSVAVNLISCYCFLHRSSSLTALLILLSLFCLAVTDSPPPSRPRYIPSQFHDLLPRPQPPPRLCQVSALYPSSGAARW